MQYEFALAVRDHIYTENRCFISTLTLAMESSRYPHTLGQLYRSLLGMGLDSQNCQVAQHISATLIFPCSQYKNHVISLGYCRVVL